MRPKLVSVTATATAAQQTAAIQAALDRVASAGGGTVSLSDGAWTLAGTGRAAEGGLRVGSNTTLEGAGQGQTVLSLADGSSALTGIIRTASGRTLPDGTVTTVDNVTVRGLTVDGNSDGTTGDVDGFYCGPRPGTSQADTNITLDGVEIRNCSRYGFDPHEPDHRPHHSQQFGAPQRRRRHHHRFLLRRDARHHLRTVATASTSSPARAMSR